MPIRLVGLASGKGTNFRAIALAVREGRIPRAAFTGLVVDRQGTGAQLHAEDFGIPVRVVDYTSFADHYEYHVAFLDAVNSFEPDLIVAAGYMRILSQDFVHRFQRRILNIHPSLLPSFPGLHAPRQALEHGVKISGCTVHFVDEGLDSGPIIVQRSVDIPEGTTEQGLIGLIRKKEHEAYVEAVRLYSSGQIRFEGRRVLIGTMPITQ